MIKDNIFSDVSDEELMERQNVRCVLTNISCSISAGAVLPWKP